MAYPTTLSQIGGSGGQPFNFDGEKNGATLQKLGVWVAESRVKAVKVWLTDGRVQTFGNPSGPYQEYTFNPGECFTSLSLWGNGAGTRLGAIKFNTNRPGEFFVKMTNWGLKTEYPIDIGSGICLGIGGRSGSDIDNMGFMFLNAIESTDLTNVTYPTMNQVVPQVQIEEIQSATFQNNTSVTQEQKLETSKKITTKSAWSVSNSIEATFSLKVNAGVPGVMDVESEYSFTVGVTGTYDIENTSETTELVSFPITVPAWKTVHAVMKIGRANVDLPYTGTVKITCKNGSVLQFDISGEYKGLTYTDVKTTLEEL